ncbi:hypothetical protein BDP27DRAFT_1376598 [Rhodocollybia butyracea]|uniref:Uncharacterized protein n=1 Tax=Rhodocollybia butyracea TaxID=206335 RepID=A0A9P5P0K0_9AGAR|nr:hypothetical protein BDP27DRAFT_1376598 [Rhodocollybia butyracea]
MCHTLDPLAVFLKWHILDKESEQKVRLRYYQVQYGTVPEVHVPIWLHQFGYETFRVAKRRLSFFIERFGSGLALPDPEKALDSKTLGTKRHLETGDVFDWDRDIYIGIDAVLVAQTRVVVVDMGGEVLMGWAEVWLVQKEHIIITVRSVDIEKGIGYTWHLYVLVGTKVLLSGVGNL